MRLETPTPLEELKKLPLEVLEQRYFALCHAMQTGVKLSMDRCLSDAASPKHLRVGVNTALRDHGSLIQLLMDKGIITLEEYRAYLVQGMEEEVISYQSLIEAALGAKVALL